MRGLENPGSLCFLIALLQQFQSVPGVRQVFLEKIESCAYQDGESESENCRVRRSEWDTNVLLLKSLVAARKHVKQLLVSLPADNSKDRKVMKKRKRIIDFLIQFQKLLAYTASYADSDSDDSGDDSSNSSSSSGSDDSDSSEDDISIIPLYKSIQRLTDDKININKPRDCADYFSKICKIFAMVPQDPIFKEQFPVIYSSSIHFLQLFRGFVQHRISPIEWNVDYEAAPVILQIDPYYYLSIDITPGNLPTSLQRFVAPSQSFPFSWALSNSSSSAGASKERTVLPSIKRDELLSHVCSDYRHSTLPNSLSERKEQACSELASTVNDSINVCHDVDVAPEVLVLHLRRFAIDIEIQWKEKRLDYFEFPYQFDYSTYLSRFNESQAENSPLRHGSCEYQLQGIILHSGATADDGHYVSLVRNHDMDNWYLCNDNRIQAWNNPIWEDINAEQKESIAHRWLRTWFGESDDANSSLGNNSPRPELPEESAPAVESEPIESARSRSNSESSNDTTGDLPDAVAMMLFYIRIPVH
jgi:hypothetical protein